MGDGDDDHGDEELQPVPKPESPGWGEDSSH
jgi:hypothetical protein